MRKLLALVAMCLLLTSCMRADMQLSISADDKVNGELTIAFEEALDMGLVHYIYEKDGFMDQVMDYAKQFVVPNKSSLAVGKVKRAITTGLELSLPDGLAFEREPGGHAEAQGIGHPVAVDGVVDALVSR